MENNLDGEDRAELLDIMQTSDENVQELHQSFHSMQTQTTVDIHISSVPTINDSEVIQEHGNAGGQEKQNMKHENLEVLPPFPAKYRCTARCSQGLQHNHKISWRMLVQGHQ